MSLALDLAPSLAEITAIGQLEPRVDALLGSRAVAPFVEYLPLGDPSDQERPWIVRQQYAASGRHLLVASEVWRPGEPSVTHNLDVYDDAVLTVAHLTGRRHENVTWRRPGLGQSIDYLTTGAWVGGRPVEPTKPDRHDQLRYFRGLLRRAKPFDPQVDCLAVVDDGHGEKTRLLSRQRAKEAAQSGRLRSILNA